MPAPCAAGSQWVVKVYGEGVDRRKYPIGRSVTAKQMRALKIEREGFHGDWNYVIRPRTEMH